MGEHRSAQGKPDGSHPLVRPGPQEGGDAGWPGASSARTWSAVLAVGRVVPPDWIDLRTFGSDPEKPRNLMRHSDPRPRLRLQFFSQDLIETIPRLFLGPRAVATFLKEHEAKLTESGRERLPDPLGRVRVVIAVDRCYRASDPLSESQESSSPAQFSGFLPDLPKEIPVQAPELIRRPCFLDRMVLVGL